MKEKERTGMSIPKYEALLKTVELGSLTRAAETLGYTQSGVSHMLNALEKEWGLQLLIRDRSGVRLTAEGMRLLPHIRGVCNAERELMEETRQLLGLQSGLIRIGMFTSVAVHWLPALIKSFHAEYPNIEFQLLHGDYAQIEDWVEEGRADCGFLRLPARSGLESLYLKQDRLLVILPEQHPLADSSTFPVERLAEEPFILLDEGTTNEITDLFELHRLHPKVRFSAKDDYAIISMVESGLGISILPELLLHRTPYRVVRKELSIPAYRKLGIAMKESKLPSPALGRFLEHLQKGREGLI